MLFDLFAQIAEFVDQCHAAWPGATPTGQPEHFALWGFVASDAASASTSRGFAVSSVTRLSRRSRSRIPSSAAPQLFAPHGIFDLRFNRIEPAFDLVPIERRAQHPRAQQALAHRRHGRIQAAEQRYSGVGSREKRFDQLQIAHRHRIQHQAILPLVEADAVDVIERAALRRADVIENCARRRSGCLLARQSEAFEREHAEVIFEERNGVVGSEDPIV